MSARREAAQDQSPEPLIDPARLHEDLLREYYKLVELVVGVDQRLVTIKGWGVTLSLASLGVGFQQDHYGLFLVAALSGIAFWVVEAVSKTHQMRYYPRMRDIEIACFRLFGARTDQGSVSSPLIDWGWHTAAQRVLGASGDDDPDVPEPFHYEGPLARTRAFLFPHVLLPHGVTVVAGVTLFALGLAGRLGPI